MHTEIKPLSPDLIDDYLYFFDNMSYPMHPQWSICYCYSFHFTGTAEEWKEPGRNRAAALRLINEGSMRGYLAYKDGRPIGWCNANDKLNYSRLTLNRDLWDDTTAKTVAVVCFVITQAERGKGIGTRLLQRVCADYTQAGYALIEAYPRKSTLNNEEHFGGPPALYRKLNFEVYKDFEDYMIMRKKLI